jgi:hypothetical protein
MHKDPGTFLLFWSILRQLKHLPATAWHPG